MEIVRSGAGETPHVARSSEQNSLDTAVIGLLDVIRHPVLAEQFFCHFNDDVISLCAGIIGVT